MDSATSQSNDVDVDNNNIDVSGKSILTSTKEYFQNIYFVAELVLCVIVAGLGSSVPGRIFGLNQRDIPYQQTANGDIMLDLYLDREFIEAETFPDWLLIVLSIVAPFLIIIIVASFYGYKHDIHAATCSFLFAFGSNEFITNSIKNYVGYWRPNFYNYCGFNEDSLDCEAGDEYSLNNSRKSFPSGHASNSFCGMTLFVLFFLGKIGLHRSLLSMAQHNGQDRSFDNDASYTSLERSSMDGNTSLHFLKKRLLSMLVTTFAMLFAVYISASRVYDNMHHPADVVAGSLIGMLCASFSYGLWHSPISSAFAGHSIHYTHDIIAGRRT